MTSEVSLNNEYEYFLFKAKFWVAGSDVVQEGHWSWLPSNEHLSYSNWWPGEPSNSHGNEHCMEIHLDHWGDEECHRLNRYICEVK